MPLIVDLDDLNYSHQVSNISQKKNLNETIDDIVDYLVKNCALLINDIEKNKKPVTLINDEILKYIKSNKISVVSQNNLNMLLTSINNYIWGYGPIQSFINDKDISDVYIFNKNCVAIKKYGRLEFTDVKFPTDKSLLNFCYNLAIKNGGSLSDINAKQILSDSKSQKDANLRIDIVINPISYIGSQVEIRRLPKKKKSFEVLIKEGMLNSEIQKYLITAVKSGLNIVWTGRGGSGKTTLINACLDYVPEQDVQLIMQESEELFTSHKATFMQKVKKKQGESDVEYTLKDLTINALLMSLDRMVIGEIKDEEAMEFFNAVYSGHIGWTSVHSPSSEECMNKIVHLMKYSKTDLPREDLMEMLTEIDLIIYMEDYKCCELTEVAGWDESKKKPLFNSVFKYNAVKDKNSDSYNSEFVKIGDSCEKVMKKVKKAVVSGRLEVDGNVK